MCPVGGENEGSCVRKADLQQMQSYQAQGRNSRDLRKPQAQAKAGLIHGSYCWC